MSFLALVTERRSIVCHGGNQIRQIARSGTSKEGCIHGADEFFDGHELIAVVIERGATVDEIRLESDAHTYDDFLDCDLAVTVAISGAC